MTSIVKTVNGVMFNTTNPRTIGSRKYYWSDHSKDKSKIQRKAVRVRQHGLSTRIIPMSERGIIWWTLFVSPPRD